MISEPKIQELNTASARVKYLRSLLRVSRSYLQEKYHLPEVTLKSWENGTTKISRTGAQKCVEMYRSEGLIVSADWIISGIGIDPKSTMTVSNYFSMPTNKDLPCEDDEVAMVRDANLFKESHQNAVVMIVSNDDMRPFYWPGDYIGGKVRTGIDIESCVNKDCIIYLKNGDRFFRRLVKNHSSGYNLTCLNPNESTAEPVLFNVYVDRAAPVIWHRWKDE